MRAPPNLPPRGGDGGMEIIYGHNWGINKGGQRDGEEMWSTGGRIGPTCFTFQDSWGNFKSIIYGRIGEHRESSPGVRLYPRRLKRKLNISKVPQPRRRRRRETEKKQSLGVGRRRRRRNQPGWRLRRLRRRRWLASSNRHKGSSPKTRRREREESQKTPSSFLLPPIQSSVLSNAFSREMTLTPNASQSGKGGRRKEEEE